MRVYVILRKRSPLVGVIKFVSCTTIDSPLSLFSAFAICVRISFDDILYKRQPRFLPPDSRYVSSYVPGKTFDSRNTRMHVSLVSWAMLMYSSISSASSSSFTTLTTAFDTFSTVRFLLASYIGSNNKAWKMNTIATSANENTERYRPIFQRKLIFFFSLGVNFFKTIANSSQRNNILCVIT